LSGIHWGAVVRRVLLPLLVVVAALAAPALASAQPPATYTWCGTDETQQNRVPDLEVTSVQQVRFFYAMPSDGTDNFQATASGIANDAAWIDQWWQAQDPTRTPRFDRYAFPGCASPWGQLDIGFIRLPHPGSFYTTSDSPSILLDGDLARVFPSSEKTIVYYDGPTRNPQICGETDYLANQNGGDNGIVYIYPQSACHLTPLGSGPSAEVASHELLHNLGAVASGAPNECPAPNQAHVCDTRSDIMYPFISPGSTLDSVLLDVGHDDYYAHGGSWWDTQDSGWLEHLPQFAFSLAEQGSGRLVARAGTLKLPCDSGCTSLALDNGTNISVIATPDVGWKFSNWDGACSGTTPSCVFTIGAASTATATFVKAPLRVTAAVAGKGKITSSPVGVSCPGVCTTTFSSSSVRLTAKASAGWKFKGWRGTCTGTKACVLSATGSVRAVFARR
jgi:hypothetical protein